MRKIEVPDIQHLEMDSLDEAFYNWLQKSNLPKDEIEWIASDYADIDKSALVYTQDDLAEAYDPEFGYEAVSLSMEKNMQERIDAKRRFIERINEGWDDEE
jgi:hypothetical protein